MDITIDQNEIVKNISKRENIDVDTVRVIIHDIERIISKTLQQVDSNTSVNIRIFSGFQITGEFIPQRNVITFKKFNCKPRVKIGVHVSKYYKDKINEKNKY